MITNDFRGKFTVISDTNKILYVGECRDICIKYSANRNTVYQAAQGKFKLHGKYTVREATAEEKKIEYPHYFKAEKKLGRPKKQVVVEEPLVTEPIIEEPTIHKPKPYRSSSGHRYSPL